MKGDKRFKEPVGGMQLVSCLEPTRGVTLLSGQTRQLDIPISLLYSFSGQGSHVLYSEL